MKGLILFTLSLTLSERPARQRLTVIVYTVIVSVLTGI